jgi:hypothetical protein
MRCAFASDLAVANDGYRYRGRIGVAVQGDVPAGRALCQKLVGRDVQRGYDLYLNLLANKLGYTLPADAAKRREFWRMVSNRFRYYAHADMPELRTPELAAGKPTGQEGPPEGAVPKNGAGGSEAEKEDEDKEETD